MAVALKTGFPDGITVHDGYVVKFRATSPADGSDVSGVTVSNVSLFVTTEAETAATLGAQLMYVPSPTG